MAATTDAASNLHITSQIFLVGMRLNRAAPSVEITCVRTLLLVHSWIEVVRKKKKKNTSGLLLCYSTCRLNITGMAKIPMRRMACKQGCSSNYPEKDLSYFFLIWQSAADIH